ncbi:hypothetical protein D3C78_1780630 [compost metagenome]
MFDGCAHQLVISRMELHQIDTVAISVMTIENRLVLIGQEPGRHQWPTSQCAIGVNPLFGPARAIATRPLL